MDYLEFLLPNSFIDEITIDDSIPTWTSKHHTDTQYYNNYKLKKKIQILIPQKSFQYYFQY